MIFIYYQWPYYPYYYNNNGQHYQYPTYQQQSPSYEGALMNSVQPQQVGHNGQQEFTIEESSLEAYQPKLYAHTPSYPKYSQQDTRHFYELLEELQEKIEKMEEENKELKEKLENLKPITIENINYKVQELSVKELSGTLNIGLTALTDPENIKQLMNEHEDIKFNDLDTADMQEVQNLAELEDINNQNQNNS